MTEYEEIRILLELLEYIQELDHTCMTDKTSLEWNKRLGNINARLKELIDGLPKASQYKNA